MDRKVIPNKSSTGFHILRLDKGEEIVETLYNYCKQHGISLGTVQAIGAASTITVGYFNTTTKEYFSSTFDGDLEITSLSGNISTQQGETYLHLHITFADEQSNCKGGHLNSATISGTCEMILTEIEDSVDRQFSEEIGLNLLRF